MAEQRYYAVGQFVGYDPRVLGEHDGGHRVRLADRVERVANSERFQVWQHFRDMATASGPASIDGFLQTFDAVSDDWTSRIDGHLSQLVARGLLAADPVDLDDLRRLGTSLVAYPLLSGVADHDDEPERFRIGIPGRYTLELTAAQFEVWVRLTPARTLTSLGRDLSADWYAARAVPSGAEVVLRTIDAVAELAALGAAVLDAV